MAACLQQTNVRTQSACSTVWCSTCTHAVRRSLEDGASDEGRTDTGVALAPRRPQLSPKTSPAAGRARADWAQATTSKRLAPTHIIPYVPNLGTFLVHDCMHTHAFLHAKRCAGVRPPPIPMLQPSWPSTLPGLSGRDPFSHSRNNTRQSPGRLEIWTSDI